MIRIKDENGETIEFDTIEELVQYKKQMSQSRTILKNNFPSLIKTMTNYQEIVKDYKDKENDTKPNVKNNKENDIKPIMTKTPKFVKGKRRSHVLH